MKKTTLFRNLVLSPQILPVPVVHDPLCAKIAARSGFRAICSAGYANSAAFLGSPDIGLLTLTEMADCAARIVDAVDLPVLADGDTGHGNTNNVARTVRLHEKAGVAALLLEDQVSPKRCGHMSGKQVIPADEMVMKLRAALDARRDEDFMIIARTDALSVNDIDDAIGRAQRYREEGADMIFVEAVETTEQMRRVIAEIDAPHLANMLPGGRSPVMSAGELQDIGYAAVAFPTVNTYVIAKATMDLFAELAATGNFTGHLDRMLTFDAFNDLVGLPEIRRRERRYVSESH